MQCDHSQDAGNAQMQYLMVNDSSDAYHVSLSRLHSLMSGTGVANHFRLDSNLMWRVFELASG